MKKIVILSAFLSPFRSGAEAMVEEVAKRLAGDFAITIVTGRYRRSLPAQSVLDGTNVRVIRVGLGSALDKWLFPVLAAMKVRQLRPDIVHAVLESYAGFALAIVKHWYPKARRILTLQSTNTSLFLQQIHDAPDRITAISQALIERAKTFGRDDVVLIPNGISLHAVEEAVLFHQKIAGRILFVGRLETMKGVDTLLRAFALLVASHDPLPFDRHLLHLRIVGGGSQLNALTSLSCRLGIQKRVLFLGHISHSAIVDEYAQAELFCGLSRSEALGNVFLEAQAAGCAVIGTTVGGIPEIVHDGQTGVLVPPDDPEAAAQAMVRVLRDPRLRSALIGNAKQNARHYDWEGVARQYAGLYRA